MTGIFFYKVAQINLEVVLSGQSIINIMISKFCSSSFNDHKSQTIK